MAAVGGSRALAGLFRRIGVPSLSWALSWALSCALLFAAAPADGHPQTPKVVREIVRLQGYVGTPPDGTKVEREVVLLVHGNRYAFHATDWQVLSTAERPAGAREPAEPAELRLQGDRAALASFAEIRAERVTILAERRPSSAELFLLALDLCPPLAKR